MISSVKFLKINYIEGIFMVKKLFRQRKKNNRYHNITNALYHNQNLKKKTTEYNM